MIFKKLKAKIQEHETDIAKYRCEMVILEDEMKEVMVQRDGYEKQVNELMQCQNQLKENGGKDDVHKACKLASEKQRQDFEKHLSYRLDLERVLKEQSKQMEATKYEHY